jgi:hypothetical protein
MLVSAISEDYLELWGCIHLEVVLVVGIQLLIE